MKKLKIDEVEYYTRTSNYGYQIMSKILIEDGRNKYTEIFQSFDKEKINNVFTEMEKTMELPISFPDTSKEIPPIKILVHRQKHFTAHYNVSTKEMLIKTFRYILKQEKNYYYKPDEPKNDTGVTCLEDLELIPFEGMRIQTTEKWEKYEKELEKYKSEMSDWNNLQEVLKGKGNPYDAMLEYEYERWDIEELITI